MNVKKDNKRIEIQAPFSMPKISYPQIPENKYFINKFGAEEGGQKKNTEAINRAIQAAAENNGGRVIIPKGKWLTGPIHLEDNIDLHVSNGAELLFSTDYEDYLPAVYCRHEGIDCYKYSPFIYARDKVNIAITGQGTLNGQGKAWLPLIEQEIAPGNLLREMAEKGVPVEKRKFVDQDNGRLRPAFIQLMNCANVLIEDLTIKNGAFWTVTPTYCKHLIVRNLNIDTEEDYHIRNGDGVNPSSCENVLIENCRLNTGDDCITIKSGRDEDGLRRGKPTKNVVIRNCKGLKGHGGIVIGSEMSGGVENIYAHNCEFNKTDRMLRLKTAKERGGYIRNIYFEDIKGGTIEYEGIIINMAYTMDGFSGKKETDRVPELKNINYKNVYFDYSKNEVVLIKGLPNAPIRNVEMKNINCGGARGMDISNVEDIEIDNIKFLGDECRTIKINYSQ